MPLFIDQGNLAAKENVKIRKSPQVLNHMVYFDKSLHLIKVCTHIIIEKILPKELSAATFHWPRLRRCPNMRQKLLTLYRRRSLTIWGILIKFCVHIDIDKRRAIHLSNSWLLIRAYAWPLTQTSLWMTQVTYLPVIVLEHQAMYGWSLEKM